MTTEEYNKRIKELNDEVKSLEKERDAMTEDEELIKLREYKGLFLGKCFRQDRYAEHTYYKITDVLSVEKFGYINCATLRIKQDKSDKKFITIESEVIQVHAINKLESLLIPEKEFEAKFNEIISMISN